MKNRFGFIPIVLPAIVMVLIIGLITMTGPQAAQAQGDVDEEDARLKSLTLKYDSDDSGAEAEVDVPLVQKDSGGDDFLAGVADYTAEVDNDVTNVAVAGVAKMPSGNQENDGGYEVSYKYKIGSADTQVSSDGTVTIGEASGKTMLTIVVAEDVAANPKMATYTIELTKKGPEIDSNSPRLTNDADGLKVTYTGPPAESTGVTLFRKNYGGGQITFNPAIKGYEATVPYTAQEFLITATGDTNAGATSVAISGDTAGNASVTTATSTVALGAGVGRDFTITVKGQGATVQYTLRVTRRAPELLGGDTAANNLTVDAADGASDKTFTQAELTAKSSVVNLEHEVSYQNDVVTITGAECSGTDAACVLGVNQNPAFGNAYRATSTIVSPKDEVPTATDSDNNVIAGTQGYQVKLTSGVPKTVKIEVRHWIPTVSTADDATRGNEAKTTYYLKLTRAAPVLQPLAAGSVSGIHVVDNDDAATGDNNKITAAGAPDPKVTYKLTAAYNVDRVTVRTNAGTAPASGDDPIIVSITPGDAKGAILGHQVYLNDPGKPTTIKITAKSKKSPTRGFTTYTVQVTRDVTVLNELNICADETCANNGATNLKLVPLGTTTPAGDLRAGDNIIAWNFIPTTTAYYATTTYGYGLNQETAKPAKAKVTVQADPDNETTNDGRSLAFTMPTATTANPLGVNLVVGDNPIKVDVGVRDASIEPNTTTYTVTVKREAPTPVLRLTLLDEDSNELGEASHEFKLEAQSKTYNFVADALAAGTFSEDDFLLLNSMRIATDDLDHGVRVSVNDGVTVRELNNSSNNQLTLPGLDSAVERIVFEVRYKTGDGNAEDVSTHILQIRRPNDSKPVFPANHPLRDRVITLLVGERFSPDGDNAPVELPFATSGNGSRTYVLEGNEAKGTKRIPANITYVKPETGGAGTNGRLTGTPSILDYSDGALHHLVLRVSDADAIKGAGDEDTIEFALRFVRDPSQITPSDVKKPDLGELFNIEVLYAPYDHTGDRNKSAKLKPAFDPDVLAYVVTVPTDVDAVDIHALASSTASSVKLNDTITNDKQLNVSAKYGTGTLHKWKGHAVLPGAAAVNRYTLVASEGGESETYTVDIAREPNTRPTFESDAKQTLNFFEGIELGDSGDLPAHKLPVAMDGSGNAASSTWMYSMKRRLSTAPNQDNDYLDLMFGPASMIDDGMVKSAMPHKKPPTLYGTPSLDTGDPSDNRLADRSEVYLRYTVQDQDKDTSAGDRDTIDYDILVHRNVALRSYTVNGDTVGDLGDDSRKYKAGLSYSFEDIDEYTYNGMAHNATVATISATAWDSAAKVDIADADKDTPGNQVNLTRGENRVTVTVTNGAVTATHVINIGRPGLQAKSITLEENQDARDASDLTAAVKLTPAFDRNVKSYTAEVETWVESVRVKASPVDSNADVSVNAFEIPDPPEYSVVSLRNVGVAQDITVSVSLENADTVDYVISVTRKADTPPVFDSQQPDLTRTVNRALRNPIELPKATGGNGDLSYSVKTEELPPGLRFDPANRTINGTPTLDEGYSADFVVTYTVTDEDGNSAPGDKDSQTFVITITHKDVSETGPQQPAVAPGDRNKLTGLEVTYDQGGTTGKAASLSPAFSPDSSGPYTVRVPNDATNIKVEPMPASTEAVIEINNTRIAGGIKHVLPPNANIVVEHADVEGAMTYTLTTIRSSNTVPDFGDATIDDMIFESGVAIEARTLPKASQGDGQVDHTLEDHQGRTRPAGLEFDATTRELSGTPALLRDAVKTVYRMTYKATDENGEYAELSFMLTVCVAGPDCVTTDPEPNPGSTPIELEVDRSADGTSATMTWRPGDDAASQLVVAFVASDPSGTLTYAAVGGDAETHTFSDLDADSTYLFAVLGIDANGGYGTEGNYFVVQTTQ